MYAVRLENGNLLVPRRAVSEDGSVIGDAMIEITSDDPEWEKWLAEVEGRAPHSQTMLAHQARAWDAMAEEGGSSGPMPDHLVLLREEINLKMFEALERSLPGDLVDGLRAALDLADKVIREREEMLASYRSDVTYSRPA